MTQQFNLDAHVRARFREAFGEPHESVGTDHRWSLHPVANTVSINVLITGSAQSLTLWVFDPHDRERKVTHTTLSQPADVDAAIDRLRQRLERAG